MQLLRVPLVCHHPLAFRICSLGSGFWRCQGSPLPSTAFFVWECSVGFGIFVDNVWSICQVNNHHFSDNLWAFAAFLCSSSGLGVVCCPGMGCLGGSCMLAAGGDLGDGIVTVMWRLWMLEGGTFLARQGEEMGIVSANLTFWLYY